MANVLECLTSLFGTYNSLKYREHLVEVYLISLFILCDVMSTIIKIIRLCVLV